LTDLKGKRYLLRLINTSTDTAFVFSIDNHNLTVIESDFVPIKPYTNTSVLIGIGKRTVYSAVYPLCSILTKLIGQRYHVIVEATPSEISPDGNYWIRTVPAKGCEVFPVEQKYTVKNATTGIIRYDPESQADPDTQPHEFAIECSDETYSSLQPILNWTVPDDIDLCKTSPL
jgi:hypothetical protein